MRVLEHKPAAALAGGVARLGALGRRSVPPRACPVNLGSLELFARLCCEVVERVVACLGGRGCCRWRCRRGRGRGRGGRRSCPGRRGCCLDTAGSRCFAKAKAGAGACGARCAVLAVVFDDSHRAHHARVVGATVPKRPCLDEHVRPPPPAGEVARGCVAPRPPAALPAAPAELFRGPVRRRVVVLEPAQSTNMCRMLRAQPPAKP